MFNPTAWGMESRAFPTRCRTSAGAMPLRTVNPSLGYRPLSGSMGRWTITSNPAREMAAALSPLLGRPGITEQVRGIHNDRNACSVLPQRSPKSSMTRAITPVDVSGSATWIRISVTNTESCQPMPSVTRPETGSLPA